MEDTEGSGGRDDKSPGRATGPQPVITDEAVADAGAGGRSGIAFRLQTVTGRLADGAGHLAAATLLVLSASIVLGIMLSLLHIDNFWTYDLDLFSLVWLAFIGAVLTSLQNHHVTAGIALENILGGRGTLLSLVRFAIVAVFLVMFAISGYQQAFESFATHETTIDVVEWPVWVAKAALPLGAVLWLVAEGHKLLRRFTATSPKNP